MSRHVITLTDPESGAEAQILASVGFNCFSYKPIVGGQPREVLWAAEGFEQGGKRGASSGFPILFPFPGRIRGTNYMFDGQVYTLTPGDSQGNAIHGFVSERPWTVVEQTSSRAIGQFTASTADPSILKQWPADFTITAAYELRDEHLSLEFTMTNPSQNRLPCGLGLHPYFRVPLVGGDVANDCVVTVPAASYWELLDMLPTGRILPAAGIHDLKSGLVFEKCQFDTVFSQLKFDNSWCATRIEDPSVARRLVIRFDESFRHCVVYNPPHRQAICIEPYSCVPDPFYLSDRNIDAGLRVLEPGEVWRAEVRVEVT